MEILANQPLDSTFERFGNFVLPEEGGITQFWGNFRHLSHVFSICTDDAALIATLTAAIRANQQRPDYGAR